MSRFLVIVSFFATISVFMDCVESKARVCNIGQPPELLDAEDMHHWVTRFEELVRKRCPRQCSNATEKNSCQRLGLEDGTIPDERIRASSTSYNRPAALARLNGPSFWASIYCFPCWIEVDLLQTTRVSGVITQGKEFSWTTYLVTEFKVSYKPTPSSGYEYIMETNGDIKLFDGGDIDSASTPHTNYFNQAIMASAVRIYPTRYTGRRALRFELIQCPMD